MSKVVVLENLSLDGVMQAPGRPDEDLRGGFQHGGWAIPYNDAVKSQVMASGMTRLVPYCSVDEPTRISSMSGRIGKTILTGRLSTTPRSTSSRRR
jgi:hypothetical protein